MPDAGLPPSAPLPLPWRDVIWRHPLPGDLAVRIGRSLDGVAAPTVVLVETACADGADLDAAGSITVGRGTVNLSIAALFPPLDQLVTVVLSHAAHDGLDHTVSRVSALLEEHIAHRNPGHARVPSHHHRPQRVSAVLDDSWTGSSLDEASRWVVSRATLLLHRHQAETDLATMKIRDALRPRA